MMLFNTDLTKYNRWQAFGWHLLFSVLLIGAFFTILIFMWFPGDLIKIGALQGIAILAPVDIVLGPLLTLVIFNPRKKSLKFDLFVIFALQLSAFIYGSYLVNNERPKALVLSHQGIHIVTQKDIKQFNVNLANIIPSRPRPIYAYLDLPNNPEQIGIATFTSEFVDLKPIYLRTDLYILNEINKSKSQLDDLFKWNSEFDCYEAEIRSMHLFDKMGCFNPAPDSRTFMLL